MKTIFAFLLFFSVSTFFGQNNISINSNYETLEFTIDYLKTAIIGPKEDNADTKVLRYKIKIPKHSTFQIEGNKFNNKIISALNKVSKNDNILIFDIQTVTIMQKEPIKFKIKRKTKETKLNLTGTLNDKSGYIELKLSDLKDVVIGLNNTKEKVIEYKIKVPRNETIIGQGNRFNSRIIEVLKKSIKDDVIVLFDIKTNNYTKDKNHISFTITDQTNLVDYSKLVGILKGQNGNLIMSKKMLETAIISCKNSKNNDNYSVDSFSIKFGYDEVFNINGNTLNKNAKEYLDYVKSKTSITIYNIKAKTKSEKKLENIEPINIKLKN